MSTRGQEFDAFAGYPEPSAPRIVGPQHRTIHNRIAASYRDERFYDGDRADGYGGLHDDGRWKPIAERIVEHYGLAGKRVLQLNAHKGFLVRELNLLCSAYGQEVSQYAVHNAVTDLEWSEFTRLPYGAGEMQFIIAASCVYSLSLPDAMKCLKEIQRVSSGRAWVTLAAYETPEDLMLLRQWFLLGTTILTKADWLEVMRHCGYSGDYRFDTAKSLNLVAARNAPLVEADIA